MLLVRYHEASLEQGKSLRFRTKGRGCVDSRRRMGPVKFTSPPPLLPFEGRQVGASSIVAEPHAQAALSKDSATRSGIFKRISKWISERISEWTQIQVPTADDKPQLRSTVK